ncbi:MAG: bifunctional methylenetetrahydrofolate dehydrogenase/methenyltetrahydrofolate cyclohydrolase FolD [Bacteroidales bacterium]|nr:bifunctional methylenetetrahydrofolate dehydrogenase/methenyltetrahydrofolate cyclohydrolase FolD [Bacteroidales bacterium]MBD5177896.1 bifunctional methylenetetrahydrofolate dehydrogenase/methenyltetrahydrofolate cyclohydrolase FolD [Bacteroidales bacterium]
MQLIDGKQTASDIKREIAAEVSQMVTQGHRAPHLAAILVGHDGGSETYVANKIKACAECGFRSTLIRFESTPEKPLDPAELMEAIDKLNNDPEVDGFIVQLPLPKHIDEQTVIEAIDPAKDVDGFHPVNVGKQAIGLPCFHSATPAGIMELLKRYEVPTKGKRVVIIGRSNIVGKPMATLLMQKGYPGDATVTVCHSATENLPEIVREADIIVAALGRPGFVTADMVKEGATVIDVGTTRVPDSSRKSGFRLCGDVDFENVAPKCDFITPVPGGVGPMTIVSLMKNTLQARRNSIGR